MLKMEGADKNAFLSQMAKIADEGQTLTSLIKKPKINLSTWKRNGGKLQRWWILSGVIAIGRKP
jgi:hypothetical protein